MNPFTQKDKWSLFLSLFFLLGQSILVQAGPTPQDSLKRHYKKSSNPIERTQILLQLCSLPGSSIDSIYFYAQEAYQEALSTSIDSLIATTKTQMAESLYKIGRLKESEQLLWEALPVFEKYQLAEKIALTHKNLGIVNGIARKNNTALQHFHQALDWTQKPRLQARIYSNLVQIYLCTYKHGLAFDAINAYQNLAHQLGDSTYLVNANFLMASLYLRQRDLEQVQKYIQALAPLIQVPKYKHRLANLYHNTAVILIEEKDYSQAEQYNEMALQLHSALGDKITLARSYINSSIIHTHMQRFTLALEALEKGWLYSKNIDNSHQDMMLNYSILSFVLDSLNSSYDLSILQRFGFKNIHQLAQTLVVNCTQTGDYCLSSNIYELLFQYYLEQKNLPKAFEYQGELSRLKDSMFVQQKRQSISQFDFKLYTKEKQKELSDKARKIALLEKEKLQEQNILLIGMAVVLILVIVLILINTKRKQLEKEKELTQAKLENTRLILEHKTQDLKYLAQQIIAKNTLIQQLEVDLQKLATSSLNQAVEQQQEKIQLLRQQQILTKEDWNHFKHIFAEAHPNLLDCIHQEFAQLTPAELRMFMLLKINLSKQEIAKTLGISTESVRKTQYRLKKKLGLSNTQNLEHFIQYFSQNSTKK